MSTTSDLTDERLAIENHIQQSVTRVKMGSENYFKIADVDKMRPFFMSIVSDANHWMFISSNGGLTAGRKNAQYALFPYYTDDKITESTETTGSKTILAVPGTEGIETWEPFSQRNGDTYRITRNLYKSVIGNKIIFEEINHDLQLTFSYQWASSNRFGFVREAQLTNNGDQPIDVDILDGIQNIMPYGVGSEMQNRQSNLVDAYKRNELIPEVGLGIYALSAIIVDKVEPREALKANIVWSIGMEGATHLASSLQLDNFRKGRPIHRETDIKGEKGAYFLNQKSTLLPNVDKKWSLIANVNQNHGDIIRLTRDLEERDILHDRVLEDVALGTQKLVALTAASDGLQCTADKLGDARHFSNTLFNIMRGGIFDNNYTLEKEDFNTYLGKANKTVFFAHRDTFEALSETLTLNQLNGLSKTLEDKDLERLCREYLPLKFSRRHGDPSRPWNIFSINTQSEQDGSKILDYEGNWRDIFQNWEALAHAYPEFIDGMILKFFNASTFDGYNPYRVTKDGFDWETIEPDNPWSYIGYWGDHQIIYALKFLEFLQKHYPQQLEGYLDDGIFVYANVPYKIKGYAHLLANPKDTITFDKALDAQIREEREQMGADAALLRNRNGAIHKVNFMEKFLASVLAKLANFIPGGGIWMNTQRPEWNDANNALVGNGVSMVTLYYVRRHLKFFETVLQKSKTREFQVSEELVVYFNDMAQIFLENAEVLGETVSDITRKRILDGLGTASSIYRGKIYNKGFSGEKRGVPLGNVKDFIASVLPILEHTIQVNKRSDHLYHAYNLMQLDGNNGVSIHHLDEMLEGQVAVLSSGALTSQEALSVLDALRTSRLYRADQNSYILYPHKDLPRFLEKNTMPKDAISRSKLLQELLAKGNNAILEEDVQGQFHFNGNFTNGHDLKKALDQLDAQHYAHFDDAKKQRVLQIFEDLFDHKSFTGRSGTFFGYEGLGSIYWHMVSKLLLAVTECYQKAIAAKESNTIIHGLQEHYNEVKKGIGVHKSPSLYGAFPTDPYSHTPQGKGAQQPGMTGQVKEDILSRWGELGVTVSHGILGFTPRLLPKGEFLSGSDQFVYKSVSGAEESIPLQKKSLVFTYCQVPVVYRLAEHASILVDYYDGTRKPFKGTSMNRATSTQVFSRSGEIRKIEVGVVY
ncbi:MAG: hypothetical protein AAGA86_09240 [Bacteroidota bacterium]